MPLWWQVAAEGVGEGDLCRHTGGTGTVAGTVDTVDIDAFAGSTPYKTLSRKKKLIRFDFIILLLYFCKTICNH